MTNPLLTLENIRSGAVPSDAVAVGFLLGEIELLRDQRDTNLAKEVELVQRLTREGDEYKIWWERDSASLGKALNEVSLLRAVKEDFRAQIKRWKARVASAAEEISNLQHDNERLMKSLNAEVNAHEPSEGPTRWPGWSEGKPEPEGAASLPEKT